MAVLLVVGVVVWVGLTLRSVYSDLDTARTQALVLKASLQRGDVDGARAAADSLASASSSAHDRTDGVLWSALGHVPVVGDDVHGVAVAASAVDLVSSQGLPPILSSADQLRAGSFAPKDHRFPLRLISSLQQPAAASAQAFDTARSDLATVNPADLSSRLAPSFEQLTDQVNSAASVLDAGSRAAAAMPSLLGAKGPRNYLFVFQNNAELRATGGLPGALSLVHADQGRVSITRQTSAAAFLPLKYPILPLTPDEQTVYGPQLGTFFLDANFAPDFPRASQFWAARWEAQLHQQLDGVFVVDPVTLSYLLEATGPINVDGVTLTAENVVRTVENTVYITFADDAAAQDAFFRAVAKVAFDTFANGTGDSTALFTALARGVNEGRFAFHSFRPDEQQTIDGTRLAGQLPVDATVNPQVGVYLDDATEAKMSYYLDYRATVTSASCTSEGVQRLTGEFVATNRTPPNVTLLPQSVTGFRSTLGAIQPGQQVVVADLMAPVGGEISNVQFDDRGQHPIVQHYGGRDVLSVGLTLDPGETERVNWTMTTGAGQTGPVHVTVTPGAQPGSESSVAPSTCS